MIEYVAAFACGALAATTFWSFWAVGILKSATDAVVEAGKAYDRAMALFSEHDETDDQK